MAEQHHRAKERVQRWLREGKLEAARDALREIVAEDPTEVACWQRLAEVAQGLGDKPEAIDALRRVASRCARDGLLFKAIGALKQILAIDPGHHQTQQMLASLYAAQSVRDSQPPVTTSRPRRREDTSSRPGSKLQDLIAGPRLPSQPPRAAEVLTSDGEKKLLPPTPLFSELPPDAFVELLSGIRLLRVEPDTVIIKEGDPGDSFFVVASGRVRVEKAQPDGAIVSLAHLTDGAFFGEMALLQESNRTASVVAEDPSEILVLDRAMLDGLVARHLSVAKALRDFYQQRLLGTAMAVHPFFQVFTPGERRELTARFQGREFLPGEEVITEGRASEGLFLLLSGHLEVVQGKGAQARALARLGPGEMVGEMSLIRATPTVATVRALDPCWVLRLSRADFQRVASARPEVAQLLARLADDRLDVNRSLRETPLARGEDGEPLSR